MPQGGQWNASTKTWEKSEILEEDYESWALLISYWRWYPDRLLAVLEDDESDYSLALIQVLTLRINARYRETFVTGSRGTSKSYTSYASKMLDGILWPGELIRYFGPALNQTAEIAQATFMQIKKNYPVLAAHWKIKTNSKESFEIRTETGSEFSVGTIRGDNAHQVLCEEVGQEEPPPFDHKTYRNIVLGAIRKQHQIGKKPDPSHIDFKKNYITSACRQTNDAFGYRCEILQEMKMGNSAFIIDYPWTVSILSGIRDIAWAEELRRKLSPDEWMREMESVYTGATENPVIRDSVLNESKSVQVAEFHHCQDPEAIYVIGYDVSHEEGAKHAKCAIAVAKLTKQQGKAKAGTYLKQLVYVNDMLPKEAQLQAQYLKEMWFRYSMEGGAGTYIAIDNKQYGKAVTEQLMLDMGDNVPLCCWNHAYPKLELPYALPVIYPVVASNGYRETGNGDPDGEMLKYAETQFEHGNVKILVTNSYEGIDAYKAAHRIKTSENDADFAVPYAKCRELCGQVANLKKQASAMNWSEARISKAIQRDMWSAFKYALRFAQLLERKNLIDSVKRQSDWDEQIKKATQAAKTTRTQGYRPRVISRKGGRIR